jgi:hypothetical protein
MFGHFVVLCAVVLFFWKGFLPTLSLLMRLIYGDEQAIADEEYRIVREKIETVDSHLSVRMNKIRVIFGLRQL